MKLTREIVEKMRTENNGRIKLFFTEDLDIEDFKQKYNEFSEVTDEQIQSNHDSNASTVSEAVKDITEAQASESPALTVRIEAIHVGLTRNLTFYQEDKLKSSIQTWTSPYNKPVLTHHNKMGEPIGRVKSAQFNAQSLSSPGRGCVELICEVSGLDAVGKLRDGRYLTVSIGAETNSVKCSICGTDILNEGWCDHEKGERYNSKGDPDPSGQLCYWVIGDLSFDEVSFVNIPSDPFAMAIGLAENRKTATKEMKENFEVDEKVVSFQDLPLAEKSETWDVEAAIERIAEWAGGPDNIDFGKYQQAFLLVKSAEEAKGYRFPIADVIEGSLKAVPEAIYAAAAMLKDRDDISESAREHLAQYYSKLGEAPPWKKQKEGVEPMRMPNGIPEGLVASEELLALLDGSETAVQEYVTKLWDAVINHIANETLLATEKNDLTTKATEAAEKLSAKEQELTNKEQEFATKEQEFTDSQTSWETERQGLVDANANATEELRKNLIDRIVESRIALGKSTQEDHDALVEKLNSRSMESLVFALQDLAEETPDQSVIERVRREGLVTNPKETQTTIEDQKPGSDKPKDEPKELTSEDFVEAAALWFNGPGFSNKNKKRF
jgi:hypothetical protein